jgi:hypothetical protein
MLEITMSKYLDRKQLKNYREFLLKEQSNICPLCEEFISLEDAVLDHDHESGKIRQVLHRQCNSYEGILLHKFKRSGVHKLTDIITYIKNLLDYWDNEYIDLIHPSEKPTEPNISKREFNKLSKYYSKKYPNRKPLIYPKSKKWTKLLKEIKEEVEETNNETR